jgi:hypothetical protein
MRLQSLPREEEAAVAAGWGGGGGGWCWGDMLQSTKADMEDNDFEDLPGKQTKGFW